MLFNRKVIVVVAAFVALLAESASGQSLSSARLGCDLRAALGFGPRELSALGVSLETYTSIATAATNYCSDHRATVEPLLADFRAARAASFAAYEQGGDVASAETSLANAISALASACGSAVTTMDNLLTSGQRSQRARLAGNRPLEAGLALLDLDSSQRSTLQSAQRTRDLALRNHKDRRDLVAAGAAQESFESTVSSTLTAGQRSERDGLIATLRQNLPAALAHDATLMQS